MVNFFIGRPIFATVLALLMLLIGGICIFVLPISLYPEIVAAAGPGHDDLHRGRCPDRRRDGHHADRAADQRRQGHDLLQLRQHQQRRLDHRGHASTSATRRTSPPSTSRTRSRRPRPCCPPEVKQFGVTIKKTSTEHGLRGQPGLARRPIRRRPSWTITRRSTSSTS